MKQRKIAVVGIGATGTVLAAALLGKYPETVLVGRDPGAGDITGATTVTANLGGGATNGMVR